MQKPLTQEMTLRTCMLVLTNSEVDKSFFKITKKKMISKFMNQQLRKKSFSEEGIEVTAEQSDAYDLND